VETIATGGAEAIGGVNFAWNDRLEIDNNFPMGYMFLK